jgi:hypothetical protein
MKVTLAKISLVMISIAGLLSSCEAEYHPNRGVFPDGCEGYLDTRLDSNTFYVSMCGAYGYTNAALYELYRAADLTVASGFDCFVIIADTEITSEQMKMVHGLHADNRYQPLWIRAFKGSCADNILSLDAHRLLVTMDGYINRK